MVNATPRPLCLRERPGTHCTGGLVGPRVFWMGAENLAPPGFDPRTIQPVASRYTDCAVTAHPRSFIYTIGDRLKY